MQSGYILRLLTQFYGCEARVKSGKNGLSRSGHCSSLDNNGLQLTGTKNPIKELMMKAMTAIFSLRSQSWYRHPFPVWIKGYLLLEPNPESSTCILAASQVAVSDTLEGARCGLPDTRSAPSDSCPDKTDWEQNFHWKLNWNLQQLTFWQFTWNSAKEGISKLI